MENKELYKFSGTGLGTAEKRIGIKKFKAYINAYPHLNKLSALQLLEELVFVELMQERLKNKVATLSKSSADSNLQVIPSTIQEAINDNLEQILKLKEKLGLFDSKEQLDAYQDIKNLEAKFTEYRKRNPLSFKVTCCHCSKIMFLKRRTENYEPFISPFFEDDKILINHPLMELYHKGKITKEETSNVLGVSPDYLDWIDEKFFQKKENKE